MTSPDRFDHKTFCATRMEAQYDLKDSRGFLRGDAHVRAAQLFPEPFALVQLHVLPDDFFALEFG